MTQFKLLRFFLIAIFCQAFITNQLHAQSIAQKIGDKQYANMHYANAIEYYEYVLAKDTGNVAVMKKLADCYFKMHYTRKAEKIYRKLVLKDAEDPGVLFNFAEVLSQNGRYTESRKWYRKYVDKSPDAVAENSLQVLSHISRLYVDSANYKIYFACFNSLQSDFAPTPYDSGIVFSSARVEGVVIKRVYGWDNSAFLDLYYADTSQCKKDRYFTMNEKPDEQDTTEYSTSDNNTGFKPDETEVTSNDTKTLGFYGSTFKGGDTTWNKPGDLARASKFSNVINTKFHEGPASFLGDSVVYFTRNNYAGFAAKKSDGRTTNLNIYTSKKRGGVWSDPVMLPFCNPNYSVGHPAIADGGKILYFASNMPGGKGRTDIYKSELKDGKWSNPENLGDAINTAKDDYFPFVDANNNLFFASSGHGGLGGLDIFTINLDNIAPDNLNNMGYPVNSRKDDFGLIVSNDGRSGFFSSNRKRGGPDDDIFMYTYPLKSKVEGKVLFVNDDSPLDSAEVTLKLGNFTLGAKVTLKDGVFVFNGLEPDKTYIISVKRPGFSSQRMELYTTGIKLGETLKVNIYLDKILHISCEGIFSDKLTKDPVLFEPVVLVNKTTNDTVKAKTDNIGRFYFKLQPECDYIVYGTKGTTISNIEKRTTKGIRASTTLRAFLYIPEPNECDKLRQKYFIENTYYDLAKEEIREEAKITLDRVIQMLRDEPGIVLSFSSHTDSRASSAYNERLSKRRTQSVFNYLVINGIDSTRLRKSYAGETELVNKCVDDAICPEKDHQLNRRTQYTVWRNGVNITNLKCTDDLVVQGMAFSAMTKSPMDSVRISLINKENGTIIASSKTNKDGTYSFDIKPSQSYTVRAEKKDCGINLIDFVTSKTQNKQIMLDLPMLCEGDVIKVENIYFDRGKFNIRKDAAKELDRVVALMKKYKKMKIELRSHTDSRSSSESNLELSENRAKASAAYIVSKGIAKMRIFAHGYGESIPLNQCIDGVECSEEDYQKNRRTEFKILSVE